MADLVERPPLQVTRRVARARQEGHDASDNAFLRRGSRRGDRFGGIDGQLGRRDNATYRRRFTPRNARSPWSQRNIAIAERLSTSGRMHRSGEAEVRQAIADGRWNTAYAGQASVEVPEDLADALIANPRAQARFQTLTRANRYSILHRIGSAEKLETRARRIEQFVEMLARGETIHPQGPRSPR